MLILLKPIKSMILFTVKYQFITIFYQNKILKLIKIDVTTVKNSAVFIAKKRADRTQLFYRISTGYSRSKSK